MGEPANRGRRSSSGGMMMHGVNLKRRFFVSLVLAVPILLLSSPMGLALPITLSFPGSDWLVAALATVLFVYGGWPFLRGAADEVRNRKPAMMTLVALGITTAYVYSMYAFAMGSVAHDGGMHMDFFWELATLIVIMLLGHWIEMRAVMGAGDALKEMAELLPAQAHVKQADGSFADVPLDEVQVGQTVMVEAGEKVPADGEVVRGESQVNEALVTGEARDVAKGAGDSVFGGSQNGDGTLYVRVTGTGESGYLAQVMKLVSQAQQEKSRAEVLSDKVARWLFYAAVGVGIAAFAAWLAVTGSVGDALTRMVTVFVIACPHALGLAIPLVAARSTSIGARNGLLVRRRRALEVAPRVNVVMMDKTGTLTEATPEVTRVIAFGDWSRREVLRLSACLEEHFPHPVARAVVRAAEARNLKHREKHSEVEYIVAHGIASSLEGKRVVIGSEHFVVEDEGVLIEEEKRERISRETEGLSPLYLAVDGELVGVIGIEDPIKPNVPTVLRDLRSLGFGRIIMLTGDNEKTAECIARQAGVSEFHANLLPEDKHAFVRALREEGASIVMVGDGVNDSPALSEANVGIAMGEGSAIAREVAGITLVSDDLSSIVALRKLSMALMDRMGGSFAFVMAANSALLAAGIAGALSPQMSSLLHNGTTVAMSMRNAAPYRLP